MRREFVSFPKSGRTWFRFMLTKAGCVSDIHFHHDGFEYNNGAKPELSFDIDKRLERYDSSDRVVYLERDPRDVMVSLYHQVTGRFSDIFGYRGTISDFIRDNYFGAQNLKGFRELWTAIIRERSFLKITYEQAHHDARETLGRVAEYLELDIRGDELDRAVGESTFEKMRAVEEGGEFPHPWLRRRNDSPKVRRGKVGGFAFELTEEDIAYLDNLFGSPTRSPR